MSDIQIIHPDSIDELLVDYEDGWRSIMLEKSLIGEIRLLKARLGELENRFCPECGSEIQVCMMGHYCGPIVKDGAEPDKRHDDLFVIEVVFVNEDGNSMKYGFTTIEQAIGFLTFERAAKFSKEEV